MQKNRAIRPLDEIASAFHAKQRGLIEDAYRRKGVDSQIFGTRYLNPGIKALKGLDGGNVTGNVTAARGMNVPIVTGNAPVIAMALWMHGFSEKEIKKLQIADEFMPYRDRAIELTRIYNSRFLPFAKQVERECEYVPDSRSGSYKYYLNTEPLIKEFGTLADDEELRRMLFVMRAIDEWTKIGNLGRVRNVQKEERTEEEIAVPVLHLYAPIMERMRYHLIAQEMYNDSFSKLEPGLYEFIGSIMEKAGYVKSAAKAIEKRVIEIAESLSREDLRISVIGRENGVKSEYSFFRKAVRKLAETQAASDQEGQKSRTIGELTERHMKAFSGAPLADKIAMMRKAMESAFDLIGFRFRLNGPDATPEYCKKLGEELPKSDYLVSAGKISDYIGANAKPNGYSSYHVACRLSEARFASMKELLGLVFELQISTYGMDIRNNYSDSATDHATHKKNITEDLSMIGNILTVERFLGEPRLDSMDLELRIFEVSKKGKQSCAKTMKFENLRIYDLGFVPYKIRKEMEKQGFEVAGLSRDRSNAFERAIGLNRRVKVMAKVIGNEGSNQLKLKENIEVYPKK